MKKRSFGLTITPLAVFCLFASMLSTPLIGAPAISAVVNGATFQPGALAPGTIISIFGTGLAGNTAMAGSFPLPPALGGTTVMVGSATIPLFYVSAKQINAQLPYALSNGPAQLTVRQSARSTGSISITISSASPGIFTTDSAGQAVALHSDFTPVVKAVGGNAKIGETISLFCTGLGAVANFNTAGVPAPVSTAVNTVAQATVSMNGISAPVSFAGLAPGYAGLYQINFAVPPGVGGDVSTIVQVAGAISNTAIVNVDGAYSAAPAYAGSLQIRATSSQAQIVFDSINAVSNAEFTGTYRIFSGSAILDSGSLDVQNEAGAFTLFGINGSGAKFMGVLNTLDAGQSFTGRFYAADSPDQVVQNLDSWYESFTVAAAVLTPHSAILTWSASAGPAVTFYSVYRGLAQSGPYSLVGSSSDPTWVDMMVPSGGAYWYEVTAVNPAGESGPSNQAQGVIPNP